MQAVAESAALGGVHLILVRTDRSANVAVHDERVTDDARVHVRELADRVGAGNAVDRVDFMQWPSGASLARAACPGAMGGVGLSAHPYCAQRQRRALERQPGPPTFALGRHRRVHRRLGGVRRCWPAVRLRWC